MTNQKVPGPNEIMSAAQAAVEKAQAAAAGAMRIPPAAAQIAAQTPELLENLAVAIERLNDTVDRMERYMAVTDPLVRTLDQLLPQLEVLVERSNDVYRTWSSVPVIDTLSRLAGLSADEAAAAADADQTETTRREPSSGRD